MSELDELSSDELRSKIFNRFKKKGVLDVVKAQLRKQITVELNRDYKNIYEEVKNGNSLQLHICDSLFAEHLKKVGYDYTLSVFLSEGMFFKERPLSLHEILETFSVSKDSKVYNDIIEIGESKGTLFSMLSLLTKISNKNTTDTAIQTNIDAFGISGNIHEKLSNIEKDSIKKYEHSSENDSTLMSAKLLKMEKKYEEEKQIELKNEIEKFRRQEVSAIKTEERKRYDHLINEMKMKLEQEHHERMKEVNKLWNELKDNEKSQLKALKSEAFEKRQKILEEMHSLKDRESEMHGNAMKGVELQQEKLKHFEEQLRTREANLHENEKHYEGKIQTEIMKMRLLMEQENKRALEDLQEREQLLKNEKLSFEYHKEAMSRTKHEVDALRMQCQQLKASYDSVQKEYDSLKHNHQLLQGSSQKFSNYEEIKTENEILKREAQFYQREQETMRREKTQTDKENKKLMKELLEKITQARTDNPRNDTTSRERDFYQVKCSELREENDILQKKVELEVTKQKELQKLNDDLLLTEKEMARQIEELQDELFKARRGRSNDNSNQIAKLQRYDQSLRLLQSQQRPNYAEGAYRRENQRQPMKRSSEVTDKTTSIQSNVNLDNLARLEKEAEELEKSYKDFLKRDQLPNSHNTTHLTQFMNPSQYRSSVNTGSTETLYISSLLPNTMVPSYHALPPHSQHSSDTNKLFLTTSTLNTHKDGAPLSSTQAPSGYEVPSIGLSGVVNHDYPRKQMFDDDNASVKHSTIGSLSYISTSSYQKTPNERITVKHDIHHNEFGSGAQATTCCSLTQHPLNEPSIFTETMTQYPLAEWSTPKISSQYQQDTKIIDSDNKYDSRSQLPNQRQRLETVAERSVDVSAVTTTEQDRLDSVEQDYNLNEASIHTFESPFRGKHRPAPENNFEEQDEMTDFRKTPTENEYKPDGDEIMMKNNSRNVDDDSEKDKHESGDHDEVFNNQYNQHSHGNENHSEHIDKERDSLIASRKISSDNNLSDDETISSATNHGEMKLNELKSISEGEQEPISTPKKNNLLDEYMQMVLNQRKNEEKSPEMKKSPQVNKETGKEEGELYQYDLSLSEEISSKNPSEKSSEFEW